MARMRRGVRVRRLVRRIELWPVAKVAFFFHALCYLLTLGVLVLLWAANDRIGTKDKLEKAFQSSGFGKDFSIDGQLLLRIVASAGAVLVLVATIATVALAFFYNGISMIFGGLVVSVVEERRAGASSGQIGPVEGAELPDQTAPIPTEPVERRRGQRRARRPATGRRTGDAAETAGSVAQWTPPEPEHASLPAEPVNGGQVMEEWLDDEEWSAPPTWLETSVAEERARS